MEIPLWGPLDPLEVEKDNDQRIKGKMIPSPEDKTEKPFKE